MCGVCSNCGIRWSWDSRFLPLLGNPTVDKIDFIEWLPSQVTPKSSASILDIFLDLPQNFGSKGRK